MVSMQPQAITKISISALVISLPIIYVSLLRVPPSTLARDSTFWFLMSNSIAIIAADSGMLFFSSSHHEYYSDVVPGDHQAVATVHEEEYCRDAMSVPWMACSHETTAPVDISAVLSGVCEQLPPTGGAASSNAAGTAGHALALIEGESAARKPSSDMVDHASALQRCKEEAPELEQISANKDDATTVKGDQWATSPAPGIEVTPKDDDLRRDQGSVQVSSVAEQSRPQLEEEHEYWKLSDEELNRKVEEFITRFNRDMIEQEAAAV